ncbi:MAG: T9SS type A sorting domain-containing protein [Bacteroidia bacterium]
MIKKNYIKKAKLIALFFTATVLLANAQNLEWCWKTGPQYSFETSGSNPNPYNLNAVYSNQGQYNSNTLPGNTEHCVGWTDINGDFWAFGGQGLNDNTGCCNGWLNSMFKYSPTLNQWAWIRGNSQRIGGPPFPAYTSGPAPNYGQVGVSNPANDVGGRRSATAWTDKQGNFWLFGGSLQVSDDPNGGWTMHYFNDLWKFVPNGNGGDWTCMKRRGVAPNYNYWDDDGNVSPNDSDPSNDMPGSRMRAKQWVDVNGDLWVFGGAKNYVYGGGGNNYYTDMWRYNIVNNSWVLENGNTSFDQIDVYGTMGQFNPANHPGARIDFISWTSKDGRYLWLYGGTRAGVLGLPTSNPHDYGDMWCFDTQIKQWAWMGPNSSSQGVSFVPVYGVKGVADINNHPGSRVNSYSWVDDDGNFWLFSGLSYDGIWQGGGSYINPVRTQDVWKFTFDAPGSLTGKWTWMAGPDISTIDAGPNYGTNPGLPDSTVLPGAGNGGACYKSGNQLYFFGGWGYGKNGTAGETGDVWCLTIPASCQPPSAPSLSASANIACANDQVTITANGCSNGVIQWSNSQSGSNITVTGPGTYNAYCNENGCISSSSTITIAQCDTTNPACNVTLTWDTQSDAVLTCDSVTTFILRVTGGNAEFSTDNLTWNAPNYSGGAYTYTIPRTSSCVSFWARPVGCTNSNAQIWGCYTGEGTLDCGISLSAEMLSLNQIKVYPNPATQTIKLVGDLNDIEKLIIRDFLGREIITSKSSLSEVNIEQLQSGAYMIEVYAKNGGRKFINFSKQ